MTKLSEPLLFVRRSVALWLHAPAQSFGVVLGPLCALR